MNWPEAFVLAVIFIAPLLLLAYAIRRVTR
jgi:hypothetical protein